MEDLNLDYPAMLYKRDGDMIEWDGKRFDTLIVADEEELEIALSDGWQLPADVLKEPAKAKGKGE